MKLCVVLYNYFLQKTSDGCVILFKLSKVIYPCECDIVDDV